MDLPRITVICTNCFKTAPWTPPDAMNPFGVWKWDEPCQHCGAFRWAAHDVDRDPKTGRPLDKPSRWEK